MTETRIKLYTRNPEHSTFDHDQMQKEKKKIERERKEKKRRREERKPLLSTS